MGKPPPISDTESESEHEAEQVRLLGSEGFGFRGFRAKGLGFRV